MNKPQQTKQNNIPKSFSTCSDNPSASSTTDCNISLLLCLLTLCFSNP